MPKYPSIRKAMSECDKPHIIAFFSQGEVASQKTKLKAFGDQNDLFVISNLDKVFSPVDGTLLTPIESAAVVEIKGNDFSEFKELASMRCSECKAVGGFSTETAFAICNSPINCPSCGKSAVFKYEIASDDEDADDSEFNTDSDEDMDDTTKSSGGDDDSGDEDLEFDSDSSGGDDEIEEVDDSDIEVNPDITENPAKVELSNADQPTPVVAADVVVDPAPAPTPDVIAIDKEPEIQAAAAKNDGAVEVFDTPTAEAASFSGKFVQIIQPNSMIIRGKDDNLYTVEVATVTVAEKNLKVVGKPLAIERASQQVDAIDLADTTNAVRIVGMTKDGSEIAVFLGDTHVGTLHRKRAAETASALFDDGQKLVAAFKPTFNKNVKNVRSPELAAFGFVPVTFNVKVGDLFEQRVAKAVAKAAEQANAEANEKVNGLFESLELAFVGINKGVFKADNDLAKEIASKFAQSGIANADLEARKLLATKSHRYIKAGLEQAKELASQSKDYLRGVSQSISTAEFIGGTSLPTPEVARTEVKPQAETAALNLPSPTPGKNKFAGLVRSISRR